jgi:hypothetical protein
MFCFACHRAWIPKEQSYYFSKTYICFNFFASFCKILWTLLQSNENKYIITIENESESNLNMLLWWEKMKKG